MIVDNNMTEILENIFDIKEESNQALVANWGYTDDSINNYNFHRAMLGMKPGQSQTELPLRGPELPSMFSDDWGTSLPSYATKEYQDLSRQMIPLKVIGQSIRVDDSESQTSSFDNMFYRPIPGGGLSGNSIRIGRTGVRPYQYRERIQAQPLQQKGGVWPDGLIPKPTVNTGYSQLVTITRDEVMNNNRTEIFVDNNMIYHFTDMSAIYPDLYPPGLNRVDVIISVVGGKVNTSRMETFDGLLYGVNTLSVPISIPISEMDDSHPDFYQVWVTYDPILCDITPEQESVGYDRYANLESVGNTYLRMKALVCTEDDTRSYESFLTPLNSNYVQYIELTESDRWYDNRETENLYMNFPDLLEVFRMNGTLEPIKGYNFNNCVRLRYVENVHYPSNYSDSYPSFSRTHSLTTANTVNVQINDIITSAFRLDHFYESGQDGDITYTDRYWNQYNGSNIKSLHLTQGLATSLPTSTLTQETRFRLPFAKEITSDVPLAFDVMTAHSQWNLQSLVGAFYGCHSLLQLPPIQSQVMNVSFMLYNCSSLTSVDLTNVYVDRNRAQAPFYGCFGMTSMVGVDIKFCSYANNFEHLVNLETLLFRDDFVSFPADNDNLNFTLNITNTNLMGDAIVDMVDSIPSGTTGDVMIRISQSESLTEQQMTDVVNTLLGKGWTISTITNVQWV